MTTPSTLAIRPYRPGEEAALYSVFHAAVHARTVADYTPAQRAAWAPLTRNEAAWAARIQQNQPWVAEMDGETEGTLAGFADLQPDGYIDHFFVAANCARRGVARALMTHLLIEAQRRGIPRLWAHVSLTAEPFFRHMGFEVTHREQVSLRGAVLARAQMEKPLEPGQRPAGNVS
jgi:putative acetyltransferase